MGLDFQPHPAHGRQAPQRRQSFPERMGTDGNGWAHQSKTIAASARIHWARCRFDAVFATQRAGGWVLVLSPWGASPAPHTAVNRHRGRPARPNLRAVCSWQNSPKRAGSSGHQQRAGATENGENGGFRRWRRNPTRRAPQQRAGAGRRGVQAVRWGGGVGATWSGAGRAHRGHRQGRAFPIGKELSAPFGIYSRPAFVM